MKLICLLENAAALPASFSYVFGGDRLPGGGVAIYNA